MIRSRVSLKHCFSWFGTLAICRCSFFTAPQVDRLTSRCSHLMSKTSKRFPVHRSVTTSTTTDSMEGAGCAMGVTESDSDSRTFSMDVKTGSLEEMCERALEVAVAHVPTLGWSRDSFEVACMELDLPPGLHSIAMPRGSIDLVLHFYESRNHRLADVLSKWRKEDAVDGTKYIIGKPNSFGFEAPPPFKTKQETDTFLRHAIEHRLRANDEVYPQWGQAMALLTLPQNIPAAIGLEAQLVDEIWAQAGDRSVDINWYAKRLGLAYVYKLAELFYIQDTSPDHKDTWDFLDRRICDLRAVKEAKFCALGLVGFTLLLLSNPQEGASVIIMGTVFNSIGVRLGFYCLPILCRVVWMAQKFRSSEWDPFLLTGQIVFMQCLFYGTTGALCALVSPISQWHTSLRLLLDDSELRFRDLQGRCLIAVFLLSAGLCALGLWRLVRRTKLCLDFTCTLYFWHFIFCALYTSSFPVSVAWWLTVAVSVIFMTIMGEFLCMRTEMQAIPLGGATSSVV